MHAVSSHWSPQLGQRPAVSKVFQAWLQVHHQRLDGRGRQAHRGQRIFGARSRGGSLRTAVGASGAGGGSSVRFRTGEVIGARRVAPRRAVDGTLVR